jgi:hypothetical protein
MRWARLGPPRCGEAPFEPRPSAASSHRKAAGNLIERLRVFNVVQDKTSHFASR